MNRFRSGNLQMLIATDVAARGIDVNDVDGVINYDVPRISNIMCTVSAVPAEQEKRA